MRHVRPRLARRRVITAAALKDQEQGARVRVAGLVLTRQRPGTASGVVFITLEDETGVANLILYSRIFDEHYLVARHAALLLAQGTIENAGHPAAPERGGEGDANRSPARGEARATGFPGVESRSRDFH